MLADHLLKTKKEYKNLKKQEIYNIFFQNELVKAGFQHDIAYGYFNDLPQIITSDKVLREKAFNIAKNLKCNVHQRDLASMVYKFFDKKTSGSGIKNENMSNQELVKELHKPIIRKFEEQEKSTHLL